MLPIRFSDDARDEFVAAKRWYERQSTDLGVEFESCVNEKLQSAGEHPESYPTVHGDIREAIVRRFLYAIYFSTDDVHLDVWAVFHTSRDPATWQSRFDT